MVSSDVSRFRIFEKWLIRLLAGYYSLITTECISYDKGGYKMHILWVLIVGGLIGWLGGLLVGRDVPGGIIGNIIAGFIGAWLGTYLLGAWGPMIAGFAVIPAVIGAIVVVLILSAILRGTRRV
jgi:uncharacterized membrane protein YeaQ/YmgE (transglycosylase-associated protein family)